MKINKIAATLIIHGISLICYAQSPDPLVEYTFDISGTKIPNQGMLQQKFDATMGGNARVTKEGEGPFGIGCALDLTKSEMGTIPNAFAVTSKNEGLTGHSALTVTGWIKPIEPLDIGAFILRCSTGSSGKTDGWLIKANSNNRLSLVIGPGNTLSTYSCFAQAFSRVNTWQFFAVTWHEAKGATWYIGTENIPPKPIGVSKTPQRMGTAEQTLQIGRSGTKSGAFKGYLDNIKIFDNVLSNEQIKVIYLEAKGVKTLSNDQLRTMYGL
ncbi:LamG domain-containing protein [Termitidicoccus mucosus]|uniref:LamG domain-containing protein n=2 Tax=Termitidicoccus mucosus TaxID=1184151 RepID=UPI0031842755